MNPLTWHELILRFVVMLFLLGTMFRVVGRKPLGESFFIALAFSSLLSVPRLVFGFFPELDRGWVGFVVIAGIAVVVSLVVLFWMMFVQKRRPKHYRDA